LGTLYAIIYAIGVFVRMCADRHCQASLGPLRTAYHPASFLKALIEQDGDRILGFTALGVEAGEVMAIVQVAMAAGLPYTTLRDMVLTHPTMAEGLVVLFSAVPARK